MAALSVRGLEPGDGILVSTYRSDGAEIATRAEPVAVEIPDDDLDGVAQGLRDWLSPRCRVAVAVFAPARLDAASVIHA